MKLQSGVAVLGVLLGACGTSATGSGSGVCVADARDPGDCQTTWTLVDPCQLLAAGQTIEAAVFPKACPNDSTLSKGDTTGALDTQSVAEGQPIAPVTGLAQDTYGFTFMLRDASCHVLAWGCTEVDLSRATGIRTRVKNWTGQNVCDAANAGACTAGQTCHQGTCR